MSSYTLTSEAGHLPSNIGFRVFGVKGLGFSVQAVSSA